jgi:vancomycin permeability regulator SanA
MMPSACQSVRRLSWPRRLFLAGGILASLLLTGCLGIIIDGLNDNVQRSDVGIVLGSKVMPGGAPSDRLKARLDRAGELYREGAFGHVLVSGGTGVEGFSEARVMADYLARRYAVPRAVIILDEQGNDTGATARNSAAIMARHGFRSALVITQYFHVTRSRLALQRQGVENVGSAHAYYFEWRDLYSIARELVALPVYWLRA